mgnify:FL=1
MIDEDAPTNSAGAGNIAGIGVGSKGEPGVPPAFQPGGKKKKFKTLSGTRTPLLFPDMMKRTIPSLVKEDTFAGAVVFEVSSHVFHSAKMEKRKHKTWRKYLEEDDALAEVREYANKNPGKSIILKNRNTGEMTYARYGKKRR